MSYTRNVGDIVVFVDCICNPEATYAEYYNDIDSIKSSLTGIDGKITNLENQEKEIDIKVSKNDKLVLHSEEDAGEKSYFIADLYRMNPLFSFAGIFCILVLIIGRRKGVNSLISIVLTVVLIYSVLCPLILAGANPLCSTLLISLLSTLVTMYLVGGFNKKSTAATIGTIISLFVAGIMSLLTIKFA